MASLEFCDLRRQRRQLPPVDESEVNLQTKSWFAYSSVAALLISGWLVYGYISLADNVRSQALAEIREKYPEQRLQVIDLDLYPGAWSAVIDGGGRSYFVRGTNETVLGIALPPPFRRIAVTDVAID